jgi:hypothetical protein
VDDERQEIIVYEQVSQGEPHRINVLKEGLPDNRLFMRV